MPHRILRRLAPTLLAGGLSACATQECPTALPSRQLTLAGHALEVEIADSEAERACGLSRRDSLAADHGMLFVFRQPVHTAFWMKDTWLPLSIAFLDADGRILDLQDMAPNDSQLRYAPDLPYRYAIETNLGWFDALGIRVGDRVDLGRAPLGAD